MKHLNLKQHKHKDIYNSCENKFKAINSILPKALTDGYISHEEFDLILKEEKHFREMKGKIQNKRKVMKDNNDNIIHSLKDFGRKLNTQTDYNRDELVKVRLRDELKDRYI